MKSNKDRLKYLLESSWYYMWIIIFTTFPLSTTYYGYAVGKISVYFYIGVSILIYGFLAVTAVSMVLTVRDTIKGDF